MVRDHLWKQTLKSDGEPVLELSQRMPQLPGEGRALGRIQRYYDKLSDVWKVHWESAVYPRACAALAAAREASRPFVPWNACLNYQVTLETDTLLSIYVDATQRSGGRPIVVRTADVWDLKTGTPLAASEFLPRGKRWRRSLIEELTVQATERLKSGESLLYQDVERRLRSSFDPRRFYLSDEQTVIFFFPMLSLGSAAEGIPLFPLPCEGLTPASEPQNSTSTSPASV